MNKTFVSAGIIILLIGAAITSLAIVNIPKTISEPYEAQKSSIILNETFAVGDFFWVIHTTHLEKQELVNIQVTVSEEGEGDLTFAVSQDGAEYIRQQGANFVYNKNWTAPYSADYDFRYSKTAPYGAKTVTELVTKFYTETANRDVTANYRLLPFEFLYLGIVLAAVGLGIASLPQKTSRGRG